MRALASSFDVATFQAPSTLHPEDPAETARLPRDKDREIVVYCEHGQRAWLARKLLTARGYSNIALLAGSLLVGRKPACLWKNSNKNMTVAELKWDPADDGGNAKSS